MRGPTPSQNELPACFEKQTDLIHLEEMINNPPFSSLPNGLGRDLIRFDVTSGACPVDVPPYGDAVTQPYILGLRRLIAATEPCPVDVPP